MKNQFFITLLIIASISFSCTTDEIRNIAGTKPADPSDPGTVTDVNPIDINQKGFEFLEKMQGHWVGTNLVITTEYPWFGWDYRAISPSHIFGIHENGSAGNLLTSFFVSNYKGKRTIMARNGGVLNGIYRTSYFVMDKAENRADGNYYRLVDAIGGDDIMYMELRFPKATDSLYFNSYTSNLGDRIPNRHMTFKGVKMHPELAQEAKVATGFPQNIVETDFAAGFDPDYLYVKDGITKANSATFLARQNNNDVFSLAEESGDPFTIIDQPRLGYLLVKINRGNNIPPNQSLLVYLSKDAITDDFGYLVDDSEAFNTFLQFPSLTTGENEFLFTYLHPGTYYVTVVADMNNDNAPTEGDITHRKQMVILPPEGQEEITIENINVQN
ncbi:hypothetical protein [Seonamhaeicola sp.]|uniref:hypothetical protein n=1 Tax=Seonamhaeicola sp. TaxID=1912245 RepID=UPI0026280100|nr:hypothetical protein [Seonamhaeicola sp.]